jgi:hypothetical protein
MNGYVKVRIDLTPIVEDGWPPSTAEWLWAQDLGDERYCRDNIPVYARGVAVGNIVQVRRDEDILEFAAVVEPGGHSTFRVMLESGRSMR